MSLCEDGRGCDIGKPAVALDKSPALLVAPSGKPVAVDYHSPGFCPEHIERTMHCQNRRPQYVDSVDLKIIHLGNCPRHSLPFYYRSEPVSLTFGEFF